MADSDVVADTTETVNVDETANIEHLKELVKEADSEGVVSSGNVDLDDEDTEELKGENGENGSSEAKPTENGTEQNGKSKESTNGTSEAEAEKVEENGSADLKRKSDVGLVEAETTDSADGVVLPEKKAKLEEKVEEAVEVSSNGDSELVV